ncbi:MAG: diguanylate cyclase [Firmicutes bacterium]|nr:diguanylate cyclase [Bacillota bacterium]
MKSFFKHNLWSVIGVIFCCIILVLILFWFNNMITQKLEKTTQIYLNENVSALSTVFYTKLDDQLTMLESQTRYFKEIDLSDYNLMKETILETKGIGEFKTIGVSNATGATMNYNGKTSGNIYLMDYYQEAMMGVNAISETTVIDEDGDEVLVLAVPIIKDKKAVGIVYGTFTKQILNSLVDTVNFGDTGTNLLITESGDIIARSTGTSIIPNNTGNLFDIIENAELSKNSNTILNYEFNHQTMTAVITPIGAHDWYFATILPESLIATQASAISQYVMIVIFVIAFIFVLLFFFIIFLMKNNDMILRSNERFKIATSQTQNIIFDYDFIHKEMKLEGDIEIVTAKPKKVYDYNDVLGFLSLLHENDGHVRQLFMGLRNSNDDELNGEFRVKCVDGYYHWFRMKVTVLRSADGTPVQLIGNFANVDEQVTKELNLIRKAEIDPLTGIFNKGAFEAHVNESISASKGDSVSVFYIIDLDNFKGVNDNLGHAMGDKALTDVSRKLSIIFNENDYVGRIGGDEFAAFMVLHSGVKDPEKQIVSHAEAICAKMRETYSSEECKVNISASVGVSVYPRDGSDYKTLYKSADKALYKVKENGKNQYSIYSKGLENDP